MKKIINILVIILFWVIITPSCDVVEEPYLKPTGSVGPGPDPGDTIRKVLLEDYTGHKCPNCPDAASLASDLKAIHKDQLVLLTVHAGFFARPDATGDFTADFRTTAGTQVHDYYQIYTYPSGLINRSEFKGKTVLSADFWQEAVDSALSKPIVANIELSATYEEGTRTLTCKAETEFYANLSGTYYICVFIVESGIVAPQKDEDAGTILNYVHNHVLRASMNGAWGELVGATGTALVGEAQENEYSYVLPEEWIAENCGIVTFIYDEATKEVLQAEEAELE